MLYYSYSSWIYAQVCYLNIIKYQKQNFIVNLFSTVPAVFIYINVQVIEFTPGVICVKLLVNKHSHVFAEIMCMECLRETNISHTCPTWKENCLLEQKWYVETQYKCTWF